MLRTFGWILEDEHEDCLLVLRSLWPATQWVIGNTVPGEEGKPAKCQVVGQCSYCDEAFVQSVYGALAFWNMGKALQKGYDWVPGVLTWRKCVPCQERALSQTLVGNPGVTGQ